MRGWEEAVNDQQTNVGKHPSDHALYEIGSFDDESGELIYKSPHHLVSTALDVLRKPKEVSDLFKQQQA